MIHAASFVLWVAVLIPPMAELVLPPPGPAAAEERPAHPEALRLSPAWSREPAPEDADAPGPWFLEFGATSNFMYLRESRGLIDRRLNRPLGRLPGYTPPRDFYDKRRSGTLFMGHVALGYMLNDWTDVALELGGGAERTRSTSEPLHLKIGTELSYRALIAQLGLRLYPLKRAVHDRGARWNFLTGARPFIYQSLGLNDITGKARIDLGLRGLPPLTHIRYRRADLIAAYRLGLGMDFPLTERLSLTAFGDYGFFFRRTRDFNGFSATLALKIAL